MSKWSQLCRTAFFLTQAAVNGGMRFSQSPDAYLPSTFYLVGVDLD